jgi:hypothetical protein
MIPPEKIDAGAAALRLLEQGGRNLLPWARLSTTTKRKWRTKAETVLRAAAHTTTEEETTP